MRLSIGTVGTEREVLPEGFLFKAKTGIRQCAEAGFQILDFNLANASKDDRPLTKDHWRTWAQSVRAVADECGVSIRQTHGHWYYLLGESEEKIAWHGEMVRRCIETTAMLGDHPWMVTHPLSVFDAEGYNREKTREFLLRDYGEMGELAARCGARIAAENLFAIPDKNVFGCCAEDLLWLMDKLNDPIFGVCWDFGHANRANVDHLESLRQIMPYLRATHVHDNKKRSDDHFMPFFGNVPWKEILPELTRLGYKGDLNFEVHVFYNTIPQVLRMQSLRFLRELGEQMLTMAEVKKEDAPSIAAQ